MGSHVLAIAVGSGLTSHDSLERLIDVSGPDVIASGEPFTVGTDVYRVPNFSELESGMRALAFALCAPVVNIEKFIDLTPDPDLPGQQPDLIPGVGWEMTGVVSPTPVSWAQPAGTPPGSNTAVGLTSGDGSIAFDWRPSSSGLQTFTVTEEDPALVPPPPGFVNNPADTSCTFRTATQPVDQPLPINAVARGFTAQVPAGAIVTCQMINRAPPAPDIDIEKATNGADADAEPGPFVPIGDPVTWTYTITNTGNVTINGITISDTVGTALPVPVTGCATSLAPGASDTCEVTGVAVAGQYSNVGSVSGTPTVGPVQTDTDPSHYFGAEAAIDIVKTTNTDDANFAPGPIIPVGGDVTWDYVVTNIGDTIINDIVVTDSDPDVTVVCTPGVTSLAPDEVLECSATGTAEAGQYENIATVTGTDELDVDVQADDPSHYFGEQASVTLEKYTGTDPADTATGPLFSVGDTVTWIYEITNTGNVPVTYQLTDNPAPAIGIACTRLLFIQPGQTIFCHASGPAEAGQHQNVASVVATAPSGPLLPVTDPANYFGVQGGIDIEKLTNGEDADEPPGPYVLVGSTVNWTYVVTNTGNSPLTGIVVTDNRGVAVTCPSDTLPPGPPPTSSMTCTGSAAALEDQYTNLASVVGATPLGILVRDEDPSNYFGGVPEIDLQKHTNGIDADEPTGVFIPEGGDVEWTYTVTNTGSATLTDLAVTDDQGVTVTCPETTIASGAEVICTAPIAPAELGQYSNTATATATSQVGDVSATDPSHYFGFVSEIHVEKFVNGEDADTAPGIELAVGDPITWTYEVTNPGNILIRDVTLADDQGLVPALVGGDDGDLELEPGETWIYEATSTAAPGAHLNIATVNGLDLLEEPVTHSDPANYNTGEVLPGETATIGDTVWNDLNADGDQDAGELGIAGARVDVTDEGTGETRTFTTDADGKYLVGRDPGPVHRCARHDLGGELADHPGQLRADARRSARSGSTRTSAWSRTTKIPVRTIYPIRPCRPPLRYAT